MSKWEMMLEGFGKRFSRETEVLLRFWGASNFMNDPSAEVPLVGTFDLDTFETVVLWFQDADCTLVVYDADSDDPRILEYTHMKVFHIDEALEWEANQPK
ncbi:MAG: hypothetical protein A2122_00270 [Candidatus Liptonbacteria bacterium GWB1_49_6]|uniref:Uncharacterized protein n=1 Tax=Candidatus Liptonbacteria bacterium GWB1_49_6 TaxID=1798644 RepID=A0A1G2C784_9BACT|nr:MAG: hypothetical protein A2122_00270 [Candidatus Liptonbacteria bacterium GWB1_49_6]